VTGSRLSSLSVRVAGLSDGLAVADVTRQTNFRARAGTASGIPAGLRYRYRYHKTFDRACPSSPAREIINPTIGKRGKESQLRNHNSQPFASFTITVYRIFKRGDHSNR
jgi:hypothetical protein